MDEDCGAAAIRDQVVVEKHRTRIETCLHQLGMMVVEEEEGDRLSYGAS